MVNSEVLVPQLRLAGPSAYRVVALVRLPYLWGDYINVFAGSARDNTLLFQADFSTTCLRSLLFEDRPTLSVIFLGLSQVLYCFRSSEAR